MRFRGKKVQCTFLVDRGIECRVRFGLTIQFDAVQISEKNMCPEIGEISALKAQEEQSTKQFTFQSTTWSSSKTPVFAP